MKNEIKQTFSNFEIFNLFKSNKRILLSLIEERIFVIDKNIAKIIKNGKYKDRKYIEYFFNEMKPFLNKKEIKEIKIPDNYDENRKNGENENYICKLIRDDSIEDFIIYINRTNLPFSQRIKTSIFETNSYLLNNNPTLIEYAAFFGSIQIFKYLYLNKAEISSKIWNYSIHGYNPELINFLEINNIEPDDKTYRTCLKESIKCHHNDVADYFINNYVNEEDNQIFNENAIAYSFHYHNYLYFPKEADCRFFFYYACEYNYFNVVKYFIHNRNININDSIISNDNI